jgi:hypothetical protein
MPLAPGTEIGRYQIRSFAGEGTFGEVYRASDERTGQTVALKLLRDMQASREFDFGRLASALVHPNIVRTLDVFPWSGKLCLALEWAAGGSLDARLVQQGTLAGDEVIRLGQDIASALDFAHGQGILHRDLKPSNIMLVGGRYALADFGVSGLLEDESGLTRVGELAGTPLYMSPEQVTGVPQSVASDVFGLGLLLFRCVYGRVPGEDAGGVLGLLQSRVMDPIVVPPSPFQVVLTRCLARDPAARPQSAQEVSRALALLDISSVAAMPAQTAPPIADHPQVFRSPSDVAIWMWLALAAVAAVWVASLILWPYFRPILAGAAIVALGLALAWAVHRRSASRSPEIERRATQVLFGTDTHGDLTKSLMIEVDQVIGSLRTLDARVMGMTLLAMIGEYDAAKQSSDRQAALVNVVTIMEKLQTRLSPWSIRHKDAIATTIAVIGCISGAASAISGFLR